MLTLPLPRSHTITITSAHPTSAQITQPAFLKPLYFEVPRSSPSNLVGRSWLFREVKPKKRTFSIEALWC